MKHSQYSSTSIIPYLSFLFGGVLIIAAIAAGFLISLVDQKSPFREPRAAVNADLLFLQEVEKNSGINQVIEIVENRFSDSKNSFFYSIESPEKEIITGNLGDWEWGDTEIIRGNVLIVEIPHNSVSMPTQSTRFFTDHYDVLIKSHTFPDGHVIHVGRNIDDLAAASWIASTFGKTVIVILVVILLYILFLSIYIVTGVHRLSETANNILKTGDLSLRVRQDSSWDDLGKLATTWNYLLDKIQALLIQSREASNNIAHDLRTPLTRLIVDLDQVEPPALKTELLNEANSLLSMINGLLRIVEIETDVKKSAFNFVSLEDILKDVISFYRPLAEEKEISISSDIMQTQISGDRDLLFQAFMNIVDNAIKFSPQRSSVSIAVNEIGHFINVTVEDEGPGIHVTEQDKVFDRFYRCEESRNTKGYGLGLSLVSVIAELHSANIALENKKKGLIFKFCFPTQ